MALGRSILQETGDSAFTHRIKTLQNGFCHIPLLIYSLVSHREAVISLNAMYFVVVLNSPLFMNLHCRNFREAKIRTLCIHYI